MEIASTRRDLAGRGDLETAEQVLAHLKRFEHLTTQADDRLWTFKDTGSIVCDRVVGEAARKSIPIAVIERGGITDQHLVDRIAIENILKSWVQELLRHLFLRRPNEVLDPGQTPQGGSAIDQQILSGDETGLVGC